MDSNTPFWLPMVIGVSFGEPSSQPRLGAHSRFHIEAQAQWDGDIETMAIRALHKAKFQQLGISDLQTAQGTTLKGEILTLLNPNLETTCNPTNPVPEVDVLMRWNRGGRRGVLQQKPYGLWVVHQPFPSPARGQILTHPRPSPSSTQLNSMGSSRIETAPGLCLHSVRQPRALQRRGCAVLVAFVGGGEVRG